jgi:hypothetical protein
MFHAQNLPSARGEQVGIMRPILILVLVDGYVTQ